MRASADLPRRDNDLALETIHGRTVHVVDDPEYSFRLLNNMLTAEGLPRYLKAKEFAQAPGITRRLRKKEQRRRIAREEANKRILQVLDPEGWCVVASLGVSPLLRGAQAGALTGPAFARGAAPSRQERGGGGRRGPAAVTRAGQRAHDGSMAPLCTAPGLFG